MVVLSKESGVSLPHLWENQGQRSFPTDSDDLQLWVMIALNQKCWV